MGYPRHLPETPLEYQQRLERIVPEGSEPTRVISETYALARYGQPTHEPTDLEPMSEAIARLRILWRDRAKG